MARFAFTRLGLFWRRMSPLDRVALVVTFLYGFVWLVRAFGRQVPLGSLIGFLFFLSAAYFLFRLLAWVRRRLLWSLRNRLIVAYLFIAVVPVLLLLVMAGVSAYVIYSQLGAYLLYDDLQKRINRVATAADAVAASLVVMSAEAPRASSAPPLSSPAVSTLLSATGTDLPGLQVRLNAGQEILQKYGGPTGDRFAGIVQSEDKLWLRAVVARQTPLGRVVVSVSAPVAAELLDTLAPDLGPLQVTVTRPTDAARGEGLVFVIGDRRFRPAAQITTRHRALPPPVNRLDYEVKGVSKLEAVPAGPSGAADVTNPVLASFSARPSQLNRRLFSSLGELGGLPFQFLIGIGIVFLLIEVAALITGIVLTRTITHTVADLYHATQYVQAGDFTHRVRIQRKDQLGVLGESFNAMTSSVATLIQEQRQRQRLENELAIAREVQSQLFPQTLPSLPGIQLAAICRAARIVSGDYYDFLALGPTQLGMAIADISGKGMSAALLMASLQAALRSQVLLDGTTSQNTADLVLRLNRHLFLNTSADRYATFFYAVYDTATRILRYTNAGHLPPLCVVGDQVKKLEEGGIVVGLFDDCTYEQGTVQIKPGSLLVAYSDGLIEAENVYGELFGTRRLVEEVLRHRDAAPQRLVETLVATAEEWAGSPEQADDMTVIAARME